MSKNFELLHKISNEKELFETIDGGEDLPEKAGEDVAAGLEADGNKPGGTAWKPGLHDVLQTVRGTLGPLGHLVPDPVRGAKHAGETQDKAFGERFPISRNPITPLGSAPAMPPWAEPKTGAEAQFGTNVEVELESGALPTIAVPGALPSEQVARKLSHRESAAGTRLGESRFSDKTLGRKVQARSAYQDPRRELIAREEELKLVQRVFLGAEGAGQASPRMALFSGLERDGSCAAICARAGETLASLAGGTVCLVDADFRAPSLHQYFGVRNEKGIADAALESGPIQEFAQQLSPRNLWLIASGYGASRLNLTETADRLRARMEELRRAYRYVIVHPGPLWLNANAMMFSKWTDGIVLVLEANRTPRDTARRTKESLAAANAKLLGVVLNNRSYPIPEPLDSRL